MTSLRRASMTTNLRRASIDHLSPADGLLNSHSVTNTIVSDVLLVLARLLFHTVICVFPFVAVMHI